MGTAEPSWPTNAACADMNRDVLIFHSSFSVFFCLSSYKYTKDFLLPRDERNWHLRKSSVIHPTAWKWLRWVFLFQGRIKTSPENRSAVVESAVTSRHGGSFAQWWRHKSRWLTVSIWVVVPPPQTVINAKSESPVLL